MHTFQDVLKDAFELHVAADKATVYMHMIDNRTHTFTQCDVDNYDKRLWPVILHIAGSANDPVLAAKLRMVKHWWESDPHTVPIGQYPGGANVWGVVL